MINNFNFEFFQSLLSFIFLYHISVCMNYLILRIFIANSQFQSFLVDKIDWTATNDGEFQIFSF